MSKASSIEWAKDTENVIRMPCPNQCEYCYIWGKGGFAHRFPNAFPKEMMFDEKAFGRLRKKKGTVFVGSSTDMWHPSVPDEWIKKVLGVCINNQNATFLFLTKNAKRYHDSFALLNMTPDNIWYGTTIDMTKSTEWNMAYIGGIGYYKRVFISFEPLLDDPSKLHLSDSIDWIIIGADSRRGHPKPPKEWADYLITGARRVGAKVFVKDNYGYPEKIKELPF